MIDIQKWKKKSQKKDCRKRHFATAHQLVYRLLCTFFVYLSENSVQKQPVNRKIGQFIEHSGAHYIFDFIQKRFALPKSKIHAHKKRI